MAFYFSLLLILALAPCGFASGGEAVDREAVANEVLSMLVNSFSCDGIITDDSLRAIEVIDQLIERHADRSSFVRLLKERQSMLQGRLDGTLPEPRRID